MSKKREAVHCVGTEALSLPFYSLVSVRGLFLAHLGLFALKDFD